MWNLKAAETKILEDNQFTQEEVTTFGKEKKKKEDMFIITLNIFLNCTPWIFFSCMLLSYRSHYLNSIKLFLSIFFSLCVLHFPQIILIWLTVH